MEESGTQGHRASANLTDGRDPNCILPPFQGFGARHRRRANQRRRAVLAGVPDRGAERAASSRLLVTDWTNQEGHHDLYSITRGQARPLRDQWPLGSSSIPTPARLEVDRRDTEGKDLQRPWRNKPVRVKGWMGRTCISAARTKSPRLRLRTVLVDVFNNNERAHPIRLRRSFAPAACPHSFTFIPHVAVELSPCQREDIEGFNSNCIRIGRFSSLAVLWVLGAAGWRRDCPLDNVRALRLGHQRQSCIARYRVPRRVQALAHRQGPVAEPDRPVVHMQRDYRR